MKVDATNQTAYLSSEDSGASGSTAAPALLPRIYPAPDVSTPPGSNPDEGTTKKKPPKQDKKPDGTTNETVIPPSPSVPPPSGNALQVKVGGIVAAVPPLTSSDSTPITGHTRKSVHVQRSNRAGYTAGSLGRTVTKGLGDIGGLAHSKSKDDRTTYGLQIGKDVFNATASAIDLKRMPHKKIMAKEYLRAPGRQGEYQVDPHGGGTSGERSIELKSVRPLPTDSETQTPRRHPAQDVGTQSLPVEKTDTGVQAQPRHADRHTQARISTHSQSSQAGPRTHGAATQTMPSSDAGTQTSPQPAQDNGAADHEKKPSSVPRDQVQSAGGDKASDKATQSQAPAQDTRGTATQDAGRTDAEVQARPDMHDGASQHVPEQHPVQTQTTASTLPTQTAPVSAPQTSTSEIQTDRHQTDSDTAKGRKTDTATQAGSSLEMRGTQTATQTPAATQVSPNVQSAGTQTPPPSVQDTGTQHVPPQASASTQTAIGTDTAATQTGADRTKSVQTHPAVNTAGTQSTTGTRDAATQFKPPSENRSVQAAPTLKPSATQTPSATALTSAVQSDAVVHSPSATQPGATQTEHEHFADAPRRTLTVPDSVHGNAHWVVADIASLGADFNNLKNHADLGSISTATASGIGTLSDGIALINTRGERVLTLASRSLSLMGTAVGLVPSVGQLANDIKQLIANPNDEQSKWNVANSSLELGGGLAAAAASMVFPPAALLPILFPNLAEIGHAEILRHKKNDQKAEGLNVEGDATESEYKIAALNATPMINWFSSTYTPELRPAIEKFEAEQGNKPGSPPAGELPVSTFHDRRVYDYYAQALTEREGRLATAGKSYLKSIADNSNLDSVTMVSRAPQVFGWPTNGQAMRVFDRAVAITYDRVHDTVRAEFFGPDKDGAYRLPTRDPGLPSGVGSKNLLFSSTMMDPDRKRVEFDLPQYFADAGTVALDVRK